MSPLATDSSSSVLITVSIFWFAVTRPVSTALIFWIVSDTLSTPVDLQANSASNDRGASHLAFIVRFLLPLRGDWLARNGRRLPQADPAWGRSAARRYCAVSDR